MSVDLRYGDAAAKQGQELVGGAIDVARPEAEDEVAGADDVGQRIGQALAAPDEAHVEVSAALERLEQRLSGDARERALARGIDLRQQQEVGLVEGSEEVVEEVA